MISQRFIELTGRMKQIHEEKNAGYSGQDNPDPWANFRESERLGVSPFTGSLIRMSDKWVRLINVLRDPSNEKVGEAVVDTLLDMANYCIIAIRLFEEKLEKESKQ